MPRLDFPWDLPRGTEAAYAPSTNRLIVMSGGVTAEYDAVADEWTPYLNGEVTSDPTLMTGVPRKMSHAMVYDPINDRVLLYGGDTWTGVTGVGGSHSTICGPTRRLRTRGTSTGAVGERRVIIRHAESPGRRHRITPSDHLPDTQSTATERPISSTA